MQRYIKKIGYKQDLKQDMLIELARQITYIKNKTAANVAKQHIFRLILRDATLTICFETRSIYKSLTNSIFSNFTVV